MNTVSVEVGPPPAPALAVGHHGRQGRPGRPRRRSRPRGRRSARADPGTRRPRPPARNVHRNPLPVCAATRTAPTVDGPAEGGPHARDPRARPGRRARPPGSPTTSSPTASSGPRTVLLNRRVGDAWHDVTAAQFLAEVRALAKGLVASGVGVGDRVGSDVAHPLRVDAGRLRHLVRRRRHRPDLRDQLGRAGRSGSCRTPAPWPWCSRATSTSPCSTRSPTGCPGVRHRCVIDHGDLDRARAARAPGSPTTTSRQRRTSVSARRPRHDHLHLRHHRAAQGLRAHPRQLHLRGGEHRGGDARGVRRPRVPRRCCSCRWRTCSAASSRSPASTARVRLGHTADVTHLLDDLAGFRPTFLLAVPRVFEKIFNGAQQKADRRRQGRRSSTRPRPPPSPTARRSTPAAPASGCACSTRCSTGSSTPSSAPRWAAGSRWAVSGGAPLGARLGHFFRGIGITILEGYGLTETAGATTVNRPHRAAHRLGRPAVPRRRGADRRRRRGPAHGPARLPRLLEQPRRPPPRCSSPTAGSTPATSARSTTTGYLSITGRKKEILVTAGGKNVAPAVLEDRIRAHWLVSQCMVVGDNKPYVAALVTIDPDSFPAWKQQHGKDPRTPRSPRWPTTPTCSPRCSTPSTRPTRPCLDRRVDPAVPRSCRSTGPRRAASSRRR